MSAITARIEPALRSQPDYLPAIVAQAAAQAASGHSAKAIARYEEVLRRYPDFAPAQRDLAALLAANRDTLDRASELLARARQSLGDDPRLASTQEQIGFARRWKK